MMTNMSRSHFLSTGWLKRVNFTITITIIFIIIIAIYYLTF